MYFDGLCFDQWCVNITECFVECFVPCCYVECCYELRVVFSVSYALCLMCPFLDTGLFSVGRMRSTTVCYYDI